MGWGPTADGGTLVSQPMAEAALRLSADIPLIAGTNLHEFVNAVDNPLAARFSQADLVQRVRAGHGARAEAIIDAYRSSYPAAKPFELYAIIAAGLTRQMAQFQVARKAGLKAAPAFQYLYRWRTPVLDGRPGLFHSAELAFAFDNADRCDHYSGRTPQAFALSRAMGRTWAAFARNGNPNHDGLPTWPACSEREFPTLVFDNTCLVEDRLEQAGLRLIAEARLPGMLA